MELPITFTAAPLEIETGECANVLHRLAFSFFLSSVHAADVFFLMMFFSNIVVCVCFCLSTTCYTHTHTHTTYTTSMCAANGRLLLGSRWIGASPRPLSVEAFHTPSLSAGCECDVVCLRVCVCVVLR